MVRLLRRAAGRTGWRGATRAVAVTLVGLALIAACAPNPLATLPRGDWEVVASTERVRYYALRSHPPTFDVDAAVQRLEGFLADVGAAWYVPDTLHYYVFPDRATLRATMGWDMTGRAVVDRDAVVSIYAADAHEVAHVLTVPHGRPLRLPTFWLEGIAMYYTWPEVYHGIADTGDLPVRMGTWYGHSVHHWAQVAHRDGSLPPLADLVADNEVWRVLDDGIGYPAAGSFTTYLLGPGHVDRERIAALRAFFDEANVPLSPTAVDAAFERHLGRSLADAESGWLAFLDGWDEGSLHR